MCCWDLIPPYLHTAKQAQVKLSPCLDHIGMTIWDIRIPWVVSRVVASTRNISRAETPFYWTKTSSELSQGQLNTCSSVFKRWCTTRSRATRFTVRFCRSTTRSYMTFSRIRTAISLWIFGRTNTPVFLLRVNQNMLSQQLKTVSLFLKEEKLIESPVKQDQTSIPREVTPSSRSSSNLTQLIQEVSCFVESSTYVTLQVLKKFLRMSLSTNSISTNSKQLT